MDLSIDRERLVVKNNFRQSWFGKMAMLLLLGILVSCYFFPFELTFLPSGLNTKILLAVLGIPLLGLQFLQQRKIQADPFLLGATLIALIFSVIGYISVDVNNSQDFTYANYIVSFSTWMFGAFSLSLILKSVHGYLNFELLFNYLIAVCVAQCILALLIDYNPMIKFWVDKYISQDPVADVEFLNEVDRLYGIGAAVDVAGTRFSIVLLGLGTILNSLKNKETKLTYVLFYWIAFMVIAVIGNMISRTTLVGVGLTLAYLLVTSSFYKLNLSSFRIKFTMIIIGVTLALILIAIYYYRTDALVQQQLRFAFEGFFNWVEKGKWYTSSTDRLNSVMWIWPESSDIKTWIIGKATFDNWHAVGTDIGYCRFIFYNGMIGLIVFSLFFVYNAWACNQLIPGYSTFFCFLLALSFIIWLKVATDLFIIYGLFYSLAVLSKNKLSIIEGTLIANRK